MGPGSKPASRSRICSNLTVFRLDAFLNFPSGSSAIIAAEFALLLFALLSGVDTGEKSRSIRHPEFRDLSAV